MVNLLEVESENLGTECKSCVKEKQNLGKVYKAKIIPSLQAAEKNPNEKARDCSFPPALKYVTDSHSERI